MGGEQIDAPEGKQLTAAWKQGPHESCCAAIAKGPPGPNVGKAVVLWKETGKCTTGAAGVGPKHVRKDSQIGMGSPFSVPRFDVGFVHGETPRGRERGRGRRWPERL